MVAVSVPGCPLSENALVEQLVVDAVERRAVCACKHTLRECSIGILEIDSYIDVVANLDGICCGIVCNWTDCQFTKTYATHCAKVFYRCNFVGSVGFACVGDLVNNVFHGCRVDVLADRSLLCRQCTDAVVSQRVFRFGISVYRNRWRCTFRNCNQPCNHRKRRRTDLAVWKRTVDGDF